MFKILKKADIVLFIALLLLGAGLSAAGFIQGGSGVEGDTVLITVGGETYGTYDLSQNQEVLVSQKGHLNKVIIKDGGVQITEANCHNHLCIQQGRISLINQRIICLPNRVMVEITGEGKGGEPDVVSG